MDKTPSLALLTQVSTCNSKLTAQVTLLKILCLAPFPVKTHHRNLAGVEELQRRRLRAGAATVERRVPGRGGVGPQQLQPQDHRRAVLFYHAGVAEEELKNEYLSARDANSHGTHTASTAAGSIVEAASFHGLAAGTARGGAPRARIAVYKSVSGSARGAGAGSSATVLAAIDDAIHDGVDVLSLSLVVENLFGALHAVQKGITVVYAAGNSGPAPQVVGNTAPWVITVAASKIDRSFPTAITLGNKQRIVVSNRITWKHLNDS